MGVILYLGNENFDVSQEIYRLGIQSNCGNMKSDSIMSLENFEGRDDFQNSWNINFLKDKTIVVFLFIICKKKKKFKTNGKFIRFIQISQKCIVEWPLMINKMGLVVVCKCPPLIRPFIDNSRGKQCTC